MSFLAPLFFLGAAAVVLPLVFHLLRRSSRDRVPFSSLMFLTPSPPTLTRRSRLEHWLLLLLRCLVLVLLAAAFARPFFSRDDAPPPVPGQSRQLVLLIDTSASMRRSGLWDAARERAERILRETEPADLVAILGFNRGVQTVLSFDEWIQGSPSDRIAMASSRLQAMEPSWAGTHLGTALAAAAELFESNQTDPVGGSRQIVLISDLQEGSHLEGLQGYDWPNGIHLAVEAVEPDRPTHAGLQWVPVAQDLAQSAEPPVRVRVVNAKDSKHDQFRLTWEPGGNSGTNHVDVYVAPGASSVVTLPVSARSIQRLQLSGDDDDFDNHLFQVPREPVRIELVYFGSEAADDPNRPFYYLARALQPTWRQSVQIKTLPPNQALEPGSLAASALVIVPERLSPDPAIAVKEYLAGGGTVLVLLTSAAVAESIPQLIDVPNPAAADEVAGTPYAMLGEIQFDHPLFAPFSDPRYSDFTKIHFWKYRRVRTDTWPQARALARFDNNDPALLQIDSGQGQLFILTSSWHPADSQLALSTKFVPLLYSMLDLSGKTAPDVAHYKIGDSIPLAGTTDEESVTIRRPDGAELSWTGDKPFSRTELPGIYALVSNGATQQFAVNLDPSESKTSMLPIDELERIGLPFHNPKSPAAQQIEQNRRQLLAFELEGQQKLWRWLILTAFLVLFLETWISGRLSPKTAAS